ncbi:MAG: helix-turn-helix domain-containing protein [Bacteroidetes bacterium]|nr:MAG: helix-turn-helix domain-containing protein [Bacteroidota bacterium]
MQRAFPMPADASASGSLFAQDMRAIREQQGVSIEAIHEETKIPIGLIEAFEESALFDHPQFNIVYLRSFVRTYAEMVGIDPQEAVEALDRAREGRYARELAIAHLGLAAEDVAPPPEPPVEPRAEPEPPRSVRPPTPPPPATTPAATPLAPAPAVTPPPPGASAPDVASVWWKNPRILWALVIALVVVAAVLVALVMGRRESAPESVVGSPADSSRAAEAETLAVEVPPPRIVLGDTFVVLVRAAKDRLDPIRVKVDGDLRRPYWIEQDSARAFAVTEQIILEEQLDDIEVAVDGIPYPADRRDARGRLVLSRPVLQAYLDSLHQR